MEHGGKKMEQEDGTWWKEDGTRRWNMVKRRWNKKMEHGGKKMEHGGNMMEQEDGTWWKENAHVNLQHYQWHLVLQQIRDHPKNNFKYDVSYNGDQHIGRPQISAQWDVLWNFCHA